LRYKSIRPWLYIAKIAFFGEEVYFVLNLTWDLFDHVIGFILFLVLGCSSIEWFILEPHDSGMTGKTGDFPRMETVSGNLGKKVFIPTPVQSWRQEASAYVIG
jgi:hypothetical protein